MLYARSCCGYSVSRRRADAGLMSASSVNRRYMRWSSLPGARNMERWTRYQMYWNCGRTIKRTWRVFRSWSTPMQPGVVTSPPKLYHQMRDQILSSTLPTCLKDMPFCYNSTQGQIGSYGTCVSSTLLLSTLTKVAYVLYPGGALCYRDGRLRSPITWNSPVLNVGPNDSGSLGIYGVGGRSVIIFVLRFCCFWPNDLSTALPERQRQRYGSHTAVSTLTGSRGRLRR